MIELIKKNNTWKLNKKSLLPICDFNSLNDDDRENFEERSAIMEFEGGLSRDQAELKAMEIINKNFSLFPPSVGLKPIRTGVNG